jgi:hypothetical protein
MPAVLPGFRRDRNVPLVIKRRGDALLVVRRGEVNGFERGELADAIDPVDFQAVPRERVERQRGLRGRAAPLVRRYLAR